MNKPLKITLATLAVLNVLFVSVVVYSVGQPQEPVVAQVVTGQVDPVPSKDELLRLVNEERAKVNVAPLIINDKLTQSAQFKAQDMVDNNYFAHKAPGTDRNNGLDYLDSIDEGLCRNVSENIYEENPRLTAKGAIFGWVHSETHYKAMINPDYTLTGFGIAGDKIVEHFCIAN